MIHQWEYDSRRLDGLNMPQMMSELERIGNEGWELVLIKNDIDEEGNSNCNFQTGKERDGICIKTYFLIFTIFYYLFTIFYYLFTIFLLFTANFEFSILY